MLSLDQPCYLANRVCIGLMITALNIPAELVESIGGEIRGIGMIY